MAIDKGTEIEAVSWIFGSIASLAVVLRLYTRIWLTQKAGWDDGFIFVSLANALVCSGLLQVGMRYGLGKHSRDIADREARIQAFKYTVIAPNFSVISTTTGKISVVIFLLRLMGQAATPSKRWFLYVLTIVSIIWNTLAIVAIIGFCRPAEKIWRPETPGECFNLGFQLPFNAFADLALAMFPIAVFWHVRLPLKIKIGVLAVMGAGICAAAATLVKAILLKSLPAHSGITWSWAEITVWYTIEMHLIIICATLPTLRQSYFALVHHTRRSTSGYELSGPSLKLKPIHFVRRMPDQSLFETHIDASKAQDGTSSQENILRAEEAHRSYIVKTTKLHLHEHGRS
ncbi:hypothetical protein ASPACDRAFT_1854822 [Aspergillus aculeatus ATCC 16872]|uniref:Rhodopsin domain-containing protein n=1 Tax=Aspergillus aculeatus (strain ATCC 16872 / CBS 172.66 / WB 5094) TaxID=690307 RepID=A0A1L9WZY7_ASPA1|nr:uncharacterized protein ASPACDRAFT_1854822 [Aspergillus aculeatus ATCC 16872]OJK01448.1 hypothetical protein ASPACDRAFT_1854822 [Aspergillus aculeatus ATCC 16872]